MTELKKKKALGRDDIFSSSGGTLKPRLVFVEEWDGDVRYKCMTMQLRREIRKQCTVKEIDKTTGEMITTMDPEKFEVMCLIYCCLDPEDDSKLLFTPDHRVDLEERMAAGPISTVSQAIMRDSGLLPEAIKRGQTGTQI